MRKKIISCTQETENESLDFVAGQSRQRVHPGICNGLEDTHVPKGARSGHANRGRQWRDLERVLVATLRDMDARATGSINGATLAEPMTHGPHTVSDVISGNPQILAMRERSIVAIRRQFKSVGPQTIRHHGKRTRRL